MTITYNGQNGHRAPPKLRLAVLGCGRMGQRHAENVSTRPKSLGFEVLSVRYTA